MALHRLFVAFRPPAATRALLIGTMGGIPGARWQDDGQLHCTLRFVGEVDRHMAEDIAAALGQVTDEPMTLSLGTAGTFDRGGKVDALWVGLLPRERVAALHGRIDGALRRVGVAADPRAFIPHVTLARFARSVAPTPDIAARIAVPIGHRFAIRHFELIESHLGAEGAIYEPVARYSLG